MTTANSGDAAAPAGADTAKKKRGAFSSRRVFILAAIGSAVGLGNIWRFPYVAYDNGGGAFILPYLVALLTAGIPFLFMDYAIGHRNRGSAPLSFARAKKWTEGLGWWQVGICFMIAVYYAAVIAWAVRYTFFSVDKAWGDDPKTFFQVDFLQLGQPGVEFTPVMGVLIPLLLVWGVVLVIMAMGVEKGIGATSVIFIPILVVAFAILVVRSLFLDGAMDGLDAFFSPDWGALQHPGVWGAAFGQIFFSLSVGFGIMITYASYVDEDTDMVGSGFVVGFANSSFELLAGIGVFAALGFMAQANGVSVSGATEDAAGIGLAFYAFPAIISEAPGGALIGVLFFASLAIAGITSLVSVLEVVVSAVRDKLELSRVAASLVVGVPAAVISLIFFSTTSGLYVLDIVDHWMNQFGILVVAVVSMLTMAWGIRYLSTLGDHMNVHGSIKLGAWWRVLLSVLVPIALIYILVEQVRTDLAEPYEGYPQWMLITFGWGIAAAVLIFGFLIAFLPWRRETSLKAPADISRDNEERVR